MFFKFTSVSPIVTRLLLMLESLWRTWKRRTWPPSGISLILPSPGGNISEVKEDLPLRFSKFALLQITVFEADFFLCQQVRLTKT